MPLFSRHECPVHVHLGDSNTLCRNLPMVDVAYLDPPYNQHPYGSNYFMLNLLLDYQEPPSISPVSGIPCDWKRSDYNRRSRAREAFRDLVEHIRARYLLISFNSEGFTPHGEMLGMLSSLGPTESLETRYNAFRGSRNLANRSLHVREHLYLVRKEA